MSKPAAHDVAKVKDAINVLRGRGDPHYATDIARYTGLSLAKVRRVLDYLEAQAKSNPVGRQTMPWTEMRGNKGGIAVTDVERERARRQRDRSIRMQAIRHEGRVAAEYKRKPVSPELAEEWARSAMRVDRTTFSKVRAEIDMIHLQALVDSGMDVLPAYQEHMTVMARIDAI